MTERYPCKRREGGGYVCAGWNIDRPADFCGPQGLSFRWRRWHDNPVNGPEEWFRSKADAVDSARMHALIR